MSNKICIHAFNTYKVIENEKIVFMMRENEEAHTVSSNFICTILQYAKYLTGINLEIPSYDYIEDVDKVFKEGIELTDPVLFVRGLEAVLKDLKLVEQIKSFYNPLIGDNDWYLFEDDTIWYSTFDNQREKLTHYSEILLEWAKQGLHFIQEAN